MLVYVDCLSWGTTWRGRGRRRRTFVSREQRREIDLFFNLASVPSWRNHVKQIGNPNPIYVLRRTVKQNLDIWKILKKIKKNLEYIMKHTPTPHTQVSNTHNFHTNKPPPPKSPPPSKIKKM